MDASAAQRLVVLRDYMLALGLCNNTSFLNVYLDLPLNLMFIETTLLVRHLL